MIVSNYGDPAKRSVSGNRWCKATPRSITIAWFGSGEPTRQDGETAMYLRLSKLISFAQQLGYLSAEQISKTDLTETSLEKQLLSPQQMLQVRQMFVSSLLCEGACEAGYFNKSKCDELLHTTLEIVRKGEQLATLPWMETGLFSETFIWQTFQKLYTQGIFKSEDGQLLAKIVAQEKMKFAPCQTERTPTNAGTTPAANMLVTQANSVPITNSPLSGSPASDSSKSLEETMQEFTETMQNFAKPPQLRQLGPYEIIAELGSGGMGKVYKAYHRQLDRMVAIKVMLMADPADRERLRFLSEAKLTAQLRHPNIVAIHDVATEGETDYIVMEFIEGESLAAMLKRSRPSPRRSLEIMKEVSLAIDYAHTMGIIHRDLKPANIMVEKKSGRAVVMDFGLAKKISGKTLTQTGDVVGTPQYMAPEQALGKQKEISPRTDIYALGTIMYELLTGSPAFTGTTPYKLLFNILNKEVIPPRKRNSKLAADLDTICLKALEKEPARRYENARAMAEDMERFLSGEMILARPHSYWYRSWRNLQQHKLLVITGVCLFFIITGGAVWNWQTLRQQYYEQKMIAQVQQWWEDFSAVSHSNYELLRESDAVLKIAKNLIEKRLTEAHAKETLPVSFAAWKAYDNALWQQWQQYSDRLPSSLHLVGQYQNLGQRYERVMAEFPWAKAQITLWKNESLRKIPPAEREYFFSGDGVSSVNPAQFIADTWRTQRCKQLYEEAKACVDAYKTQRIPEKLELARWFATSVVAMDKGHQEAADLLSQIQIITQSQHRSLVELLMKLSATKSSLQTPILKKALEGLHHICLLNCTFVPAYYQMARMEHQAGKREEAIGYYETTCLRERFNFLPLYYLSELYFYQWQESLRNLCSEITSPGQEFAIQHQKLSQKIEKIQEELEKSPEGKEYTLYTQMNSFYRLLMQKQSGMVAKYRPGAYGCKRNFYICPPDGSAGESQTPEYQEGIAVYHQLLQLLQKIPTAPFIEQIFYLRGQLYFDLALLQEKPSSGYSYFNRALESFQQAIGWQNFYPEAWQSLGDAYYYLNDYAHAEEAYSKYFEMLALVGDPKNTCPWTIKNYNRYILALFNQQKSAVARTELEQYVQSHELYKTQHDSYPGNRYELITSYILLALLYLEGNHAEGLARIQDKLDYRVLKLKGPVTGSVIHAMTLLKLGKHEQAKSIMESLCKYGPSAKLVHMLGQWKGLLRQITHFLHNYDDPFTADPQIRKIPEVKLLDRFTRELLQDSETWKQSVEIAHDPGFFKQISRIIAADQQLNSDFAALMEDSFGVAIPLLLIIDFYGKAGIEESQKLLLNMGQLPSAQLYYWRACHLYRLGFSSREARTFLEKSLQDITVALEKSPAQMCYHYAAAILFGELATEAPTLKEKASFHLQLARELGWEHVEYTRLDPAFQILRPDPHFNKLLTTPVKPLSHTSWEEIAARRSQYSQAQQSYQSVQLLRTYKAAVYQNLETVEAKSAISGQPQQQK